MAAAAGSRRTGEGVTLLELIVVAGLSLGVLTLMLQLTPEQREGPDDWHRKVVNDIVEVVNANLIFGEIYQKHRHSLENANSPEDSGIEKISDSVPKQRNFCGVYWNAKDEMAGFALSPQGLLALSLLSPARFEHRPHGVGAPPQDKGNVLRTKLIADGGTGLKIVFRAGLPHKPLFIDYDPFKEKEYKAFIDDFLAASDRPLEDSLEDSPKRGTVDGNPVDEQLILVAGAWPKALADASDAHKQFIWPYLRKGCNAFGGQFYFSTVLPANKPGGGSTSEEDRETIYSLLERKLEGRCMELIGWNPDGTSEHRISVHYHQPC